MSLNRSIGVDWHSTNYTSLNNSDIHKLPFSAGGGTGIELGFGKYFTSRFSLSGSVGYRQILAFKFENANGVSNKSSVSFNYKMLTAGLNYAIYKSEKLLEEVSLGGMVIYSDAGKLRIIEDQKRIALDRFDNSYGWQLHTNFILNLFSKTSLKGETAIAYRSVNFKNSETNHAPRYGELNGQGINFSFGLRKYF